VTPDHVPWFKEALAEIYRCGNTGCDCTSEDDHAQTLPLTDKEDTE
jgi:hypothetical protein